MAKRDASTQMALQQGTNLGHQDHSTPVAPDGATLTDISVGSDGHKLAVYWTESPSNKKAKQAFVMIHGRNRNGDEYWTTMNNILQSALDDGYASADKNAIIVAPQFYSKKLNSRQYEEDELAWADINAWQAGESAIYPSGTKESSFDALDAFYDEFSNTSKYPNLEELVYVGHGGGGQLINRYGIVAKDMSSGSLKVRFVAGDPSSSAYFTTDRPVTDTSIASKKSCPLYNTWRYGFDDFTGTLDGLKTPQEYFAQNIVRDVRYIVGRKDTASNGDQYCMALLQGGVKRRDRNLSWWKYINMLARTNEDVSKFPGNFSLSTLPDWSSISNNKISHTLTVIVGATHDAMEVFGSADGRTVLFEASQSNVAKGWRPKGYKASGISSTTTSTSAAAKAKSTASISTISQQSSSTSASTAAGTMMREMSNTQELLKPDVQVKVDIRSSLYVFPPPSSNSDVSPASGSRGVEIPPSCPLGDTSHEEDVVTFHPPPSFKMSRSTQCAVLARSLT
ncbi:hypothetical protein BCV70DRAFT_213061 [Testicularia cyperi]|uniref:Uncharacterized protein n=1 Tax=Testicularia cyperi TaxID=1882483 RepID=A0A317XJ47_9BASI|nr:hypothetical protein BCV70DRAFT_213061 [Testicularia cyperi]